MAITTKTQVKANQIKLRREDEQWLADTFLLSLKEIAQLVKWGYFPETQKRMEDEGVTFKSGCSWLWLRVEIGRMTSWEKIELNCRIANEKGIKLSFF